MTPDKKLTPALLLAAVLLALSAADAGGKNPGTNSCKADFYEYLDAGEIDSVNGLAIHPRLADTFAVSRICRPSDKPFLAVSGLFPFDTLGDWL